MRRDDWLNIFGANVITIPKKIRKAFGIIEAKGRIHVIFDDYEAEPPTDEEVVNAELEEYKAGNKPKEKPTTSKAVKDKGKDALKKLTSG